MQTVQTVQQLVTTCIRKSNLQVSDLPHFVANAANTEKEHFVKLDVIIRSHYGHYKTKTFQAGVNALMDYRNIFNSPENIFSVPSNLNAHKRNITNYYLNHINNPQQQQITPALRQYILEASPLALQLIATITPQEVRDSLIAYVNWLQSL